MKNLLGLLILFAGVALAQQTSNIAIVTVRQDPRVNPVAASLQKFVADAVRHKHGVTISITLDANDVDLDNGWMISELTHAGPLFGAAAGLSDPPPNFPSRTGNVRLVGTVVTGTYTITDSTGNVLGSEPFNLGFLDMNHFERKVPVTRDAGQYIAQRVMRLSGS